MSPRELLCVCPPVVFSTTIDRSLVPRRYSSANALHTLTDPLNLTRSNEYTDQMASQHRIMCGPALRKQVWHIYFFCISCGRPLTRLDQAALLAPRCAARRDHEGATPARPSRPDGGRRPINRDGGRPASRQLARKQKRKEAPTTSDPHGGSDRERPSLL